MRFMWRVALSALLAGAAPVLLLAFSGCGGAVGFGSGGSGHQKWTYTTTGDVFSSPAIAADGTIYVGSADKRLHAVNPDGSVKWVSLTGGSVDSSPTVAADGTIYVGSADKNLYALDPVDGTVAWSFLTGGVVTSSPAIADDGTIYVGSADMKLYAIDPLGAKVWESPTTGEILSSPAIGADGTIYMGSNDGRLYAIDPLDGSQKWSLVTGFPVESSPTVGGDGTIYFGDDGGTVYALDPSGTPKWFFPPAGTVGPVASSPALGADGTVYIGSADGNLYALDPTDGAMIWAFATGGAVTSSPFVGSDGRIYVGSDDGLLYALRPDGSVAWEFATGGMIQSSPVMSDSGYLYVGSFDHKVYALNTGAAGPDAGSDWPMFRHDRKHTARVGAPLAPPALAGAIFVPGSEHQTIQSAIDAAPAGGRVVVLPGRYLESLDFRGKALTVESLEGPQVTTLSGCSQTEPAVSFTRGEGPDAVLRGFTVTGGSVGVRVSGASPTLEGNVLISGLDCEDLALTARLKAERLGELASGLRDCLPEREVEPLALWLAGRPEGVLARFAERAGLAARDPAAGKPAAERGQAASRIMPAAAGAPLGEGRGWRGMLAVTVGAVLLALVAALAFRRLQAKTGTG